MPPVRLTGDLGTGGPRMLDVVARNVANDGTMIVAFEYHFQPSVDSLHRVCNRIYIDAIEFAIAATRIDSEADGFHLPDDAIVVAAGVTPLPANGLCDPFKGRGSIVLPVGYFESEAHRTWTVILRSRGCRDENGVLGASRVLSAEFRHSSVALHTVLDVGTIRVMLDGTASETK